MSADEIGIKIEKLPDHVVAEVIDYIDFLLSKYGSEETAKSKFKFDWEGGLYKLKDKYTSVELQHKASEWR
ncbi:MAG: DUF2281 domain-containing protein [bacterium]